MVLHVSGCIQMVSMSVSPSPVPAEDIDINSNEENINSVDIVRWYSVCHCTPWRFQISKDGDECIHIHVADAVGGRATA